LRPCFLTSRQGCSKEQNEGFKSGHLHCNFPGIIWAEKTLV
jgi:hypothetical protein